MLLVTTSLRSFPKIRVRVICKKKVLTMLQGLLISKFSSLFPHAPAYEHQKSSRTGILASARKKVGRATGGERGKQG